MSNIGFSVATVLLLGLSPAPAQVFCVASAKNQDFSATIAGQEKSLTPAIGAGQFVAISDHDTNFTSQDGITWLPGALECAVSGQLITAHGNGIFVRVGSSSGIEKSTNGVLWRGQCSGIPNRLYSVAFGNGLFVAVGNEGALISSVDGVKWTTRNSGTEERLRGIAFGGKRFVVVGYEGTILSSKNGRNWSHHTSGTAERLMDVAYGNSRFVAVGWHGVVLTSENGVSWTRRDSGTPWHLRHVVFRSTSGESLNQTWGQVTTHSGH